MKKYMVRTTAPAQVSGAATRLEADPVQLEVFIESLCPDSINFMTNQLAVVYPLLNSIMTVNITAYGFASVSIVHFTVFVVTIVFFLL